MWRDGCWRRDQLANGSAFREATDFCVVRAPFAEICSAKSGRDSDLNVSRPWRTGCYPRLNEFLRIREEALPGPYIVVVVQRCNSRMSCLYVPMYSMARLVVAPNSYERFPGRFFGCVGTHRTML